MRTGLTTNGRELNDTRIGRPCGQIQTVTFTLRPRSVEGSRQSLAASGQYLATPNIYRFTMPNTRRAWRCLRNKQLSRMSTSNIRQSSAQLARVHSFSRSTPTKYMVETARTARCITTIRQTDPALSHYYTQALRNDPMLILIAHGRIRLYRTALYKAPVAQLDRAHGS